ncbi:hypothetical protein OAF37_03815 [Rubripirellula sp.]|nr:hypothetical protein [Rubripirellula sp.]MDB4393961.1 hypothetical protein [Rhodopirellula sp.]MDB4477358.1 hypothetical protein [Rhodopirellula sp.]MDB4645165.1 hypothetical protein [Rubripirellula sp.]
MSVIDSQQNIQTPSASRWRLWIDGCGGYLLVNGVQWSVGGLSRATNADVCVQADWPRLAGQISRRGADYFWQGQNSLESKTLLTDGTPFPIQGSALMTLGKPSQLSDTAVLSLNAPHRFDQHVDGVVLVRETVLVGPGSDCHLRCRGASDRAILQLKDNQWYAKAGLLGDFQKLEVGHRVVIQSLAMTLEMA